MRLILLFCVVLFSGALWAGEKLPKDSLFHLRTDWQASYGTTVKLQDFKGQKFLLTMVYTSCAHACPFTISLIKEIEAAAKNKNFKIIMVSFDPKRDTPKHNSEFLKKRNLDPERWILLTGPSEAAVRELAIVLGINYKELDNGDFAHSNIISVLGPEGVVSAQLDGFESSIDPIVKVLND